jgi:hypothetical protein
MVAVSQGSSVGIPAADRGTRPLDRPVHLDVYVPCPAAADSRALLRLQRLALLNRQISLGVMCGVEAPEWARHAGGVDMTIVLNDTIVLRGGGGEGVLGAMETATWGEPERLDLVVRGRASPTGEHRLGASKVDGAVAVV